MARATGRAGPFEAAFPDPPSKLGQRWTKAEKTPQVRRDSPNLSELDFGGPVL
jgi:hypothetical protein